ncbi:crotonase/enoyl-CoA hydratase family protein [Xenophilus azovorans]|uniref:crotonase/enoyl-CoA hydratase family protein n=1 Tax=Xenophilus azovorans TaxID=151755 RepID=UPI00056FD02F|nr:crotonase/enoyl-CoA hydratase family protein [Xenophilus azovorans]
MPDYLTQEQHGHVLVLTMNDPQRRNPLTGNSAVQEFVEVCARVQAGGSVRAVVITGAGSAFSAGGDIRGMQQQAGGAVPGLDVRRGYVEGIQRLPLALAALDVPVIAAVNGAAIGAGLDLACACDMRIASGQARFAASFVKLGLVPGDGGAWLLQRIVGISRAAELILSGDAFDAHQALAWGLVSQVVPAASLLSDALALAQRIAQNPPQAVRLSKRLLRDGMHGRLDESLRAAASLQALLQQTPDHLEAIAAFLEKRTPVFQG